MGRRRNYFAPPVAQRCDLCGALQPIWYTGRYCINHDCRLAKRVCIAESGRATLRPDQISDPNQSFAAFCQAQQARVHGHLSKAMQIARARRRNTAAALLDLVECEQTTRK